MLETCYRKDYTTRDPTLDYSQKCSTRLPVRKWNEIIGGKLDGDVEIISLDDYIDRISQSWSKPPIIHSYSTIIISPPPQTPLDLQRELDTFRTNMSQILGNPYSIPVYKNFNDIKNDAVDNVNAHRDINKRDFDEAVRELRIALHVMPGQLHELKKFLNKYKLVLDYKENTPIPNILSGINESYETEYQKLLVMFRNTVRQLQYYAKEIQEHVTDVDKYKADVSERKKALKARQDLFVKETEEYQKWLKDTSTMKSIVMFNVRNYFRCQGPEGHLNEAIRISRCAEDKDNIVNDNWPAQLNYHSRRYVGHYTLENWLKLENVVYEKELIHSIATYLRTQPKRRKVVHNLFEVGGMMGTFGKELTEGGKKKTPGSVSQRRERARKGLLLKEATLETQLFDEDDVSDDEIEKLENAQLLTRVYGKEDGGKGGGGKGKVGYDSDEDEEMAAKQREMDAKQKERDRKASMLEAKEKFEKQMQEEKLKTEKAKATGAYAKSQAEEAKNDPGTLLRTAKAKAETVEAQLKNAQEKGETAQAAAIRKALLEQQKYFRDTTAQLERTRLDQLKTQKNMENSERQTVSKEAVAASKLAQTETATALKQTEDAERREKLARNQIASNAKELKELNGYEETFNKLNDVSYTINFSNIHEAVLTFQTDRAAIMSTMESLLETKALLVEKEIQKLNVNRQLNAGTSVKNIQDLYACITKYMIDELPDKKDVAGLWKKLQNTKDSIEQSYTATKLLEQCDIEIKDKYEKPNLSELFTTIQGIFKPIEKYWDTHVHNCVQLSRSLEDSGSRIPADTTNGELREKLNDNVPILVTKVKAFKAMLHDLKIRINAIILPDGKTYIERDYANVTNVQVSSIQTMVNTIQDDHRYLKRRSKLQDDLVKYKTNFRTREINFNDFLEHTALIEGCLSVTENRAVLKKSLSDIDNVMKGTDDRKRYLYFSVSYAEIIKESASNNQSSLLDEDDRRWLNANIYTIPIDTGLFKIANEFFKKVAVKHTDVGKFTRNDENLAETCQNFITLARQIMNISDEELAKYAIVNSEALIKSLSLSDSDQQILAREIAMGYYERKKCIDYDFYFYAMLFIALWRKEINLFEKDGRVCEIPFDIALAAIQRIKHLLAIVIFEDYARTFSGEKVKQIVKIIKYHELCYFAYVRRDFVVRFRENGYNAFQKVMIGRFNSMKGFIEYVARTTDIMIEGNKISLAGILNLPWYLTNATY